MTNNLMLNLFMKLREKGISEKEALILIDNEKHHSYPVSQIILDSMKHDVHELLGLARFRNDYIDNHKKLLDYFPPSKKDVWKERMRKFRNS